MYNFPTFQVCFNPFPLFQNIDGMIDLEKKIHANSWSQSKIPIFPNLTQWKLSCYYVYKKLQIFLLSKTAFSQVSVYRLLGVSSYNFVVLQDGTFEEVNFFDRNKYVDTILRCVFQNAKSRRIVFSSFDPDTCVL